jgi:hypothetical protein
MAKLPYPGILTDKGRINLEAAEYKAPIHFIYFTYSVIELNKSKVIARLPISAMTWGLFSFRTTEIFGNNQGLASDTELFIGTDRNAASILKLFIQSRGVHITDISGGTGVSFRTGLNHLEITKEPTNIRILLVPREMQTPPVTGRGWGVIPWLDMNQVEGY